MEKFGKILTNTQGLCCILMGAFSKTWAKPCIEL